MAGVPARKKRENGERETITEIFPANISALKARLFIVQQSTEDKGEDPKSFKRAHADHTQRTKNQNGNRPLNSKSGSQKITEQCFQNSRTK